MRRRVSSVVARPAGGGTSRGAGGGATWGRGTCGGGRARRGLVSARRGAGDGVGARAVLPEGGARHGRPRRPQFFPRACHIFVANGDVPDREWEVTIRRADGTPLGTRAANRSIGRARRPSVGGRSGRTATGPPAASKRPT